MQKSSVRSDVPIWVSESGVERRLWKIAILEMRILSEISVVFVVYERKYACVLSSLHKNNSTLEFGKEGIEKKRSEELSPTRVFYHFLWSYLQWIRVEKNTFRKQKQRLFIIVWYIKISCKSLFNTTRKFSWLKSISILKYFLNQDMRYQKKIQLIILQQIFIFYDTTCNFYDTEGRLN